eukprot:CAMPEP_0119351102 /NCGR_PEP_ID=MMETSP1334-20130426/386_1 /TAXON_ID=127549 /ORGANISM="Calcidiscus leptoporus, Strain RCC1130" /LENGTH=92 /DNA_ID=CAMNT_0007363823 /DNA_START=260 /DNA_END=534 /DNA_ORIENTATION=-
MPFSLCMRRICPPGDLGGVWRVQGKLPEVWLLHRGVYCTGGSCVDRSGVLWMQPSSPEAAAMSHGCMGVAAAAVAPNEGSFIRAAEALPVFG